MLYLIGGILLGLGLVGVIYIYSQRNRASDELNAGWGGFYMFWAIVGFVLTIINFDQGPWVQRFPASAFGVGVGLMTGALGLYKSKDNFAQKLIGLTFLPGFGLALAASVVWLVITQPDITIK